MDILHWVKSLWPALPIQRESSLERWRKWLIDILLLMITVFIFPVVAGFAMPNLWAEEHYLLIGMYAVFYGLSLLHVLTKGRGLLARRPFFLLSFYVLAFAHIIFMGPHYPRSIWLIVCVICAVFLYGTWVAVFSSFANAVILITLYLTMSPENQAWAGVLQVPSRIWISHIIYLSLFSLGATLPIGFLLERLNRSLRHERTMLHALEAGNADLASEIVERKKVEAKLKARDHELYSIITHTPDIIYRLDPEGRIAFISGAVERYGYTAAELKGRDIIELVHPEDREKVKWRVRERRKGSRGTEGFLLRLLTKNQESINFESRCAKIPEDRVFSLDAEGLYGEDGSGNFLGTQGIARDVTDRIKREEEKKELIKQLQESQRLEAIGTLAGGIAHDFNNILAGMIGYAELAMTDLSKDSLKLTKYLERILSAGDRAKNLVQQILDFSRQRDQEIKPVRLKYIVDESLKLLRASLPTTIEITQNIQSSAFVTASSTNMHQVVMNLCTNAYHAMRSQGGTLTVGLHEEYFDKQVENEMGTAQPGNYAVLSVSDTGTGMSENVRRRIFEPYFTTKGLGEGTGLGLSVIHGIVHNHKGWIEIETEEGRGTLFRIFLPLSHQVLSNGEGQDKEVPKGNGEKILLVDDEDFFLDVMTKLLEMLNYRPEATESSSKALEVFLKTPYGFDLIVTDQTMPEMTGVQLVSEVRKVNGEIPVILCTGFSESICKETAESYGITRFLMKPVNRKAIAQSVFEALGNGSKEKATFAGNPEILLRSNSDRRQ
ncbi:MAG: response regulator [Deltaproteobacteria bacterium]|nr:response regulator [Deltaproteobacteria bacterium]